MDQKLMDLKQRALWASTEFVKAQRVYLEASDPYARKSEMMLKKAAEEYLKASAPYETALQDLRQYLLEQEPSELVAQELDHAEQFMNALGKEKKVALELIAHHAELITTSVKQNSQPAEDGEG